MPPLSYRIPSITHARDHTTPAPSHFGLLYNLTAVAGTSKPGIWRRRPLPALRPVNFETPSGPPASDVTDRTCDVTDAANDVTDGGRPEGKSITGTGD